MGAMDSQKKLKKKKNAKKDKDGDSGMGSSEGFVQKEEKLVKAVEEKKRKKMGADDLQKMLKKKKKIKKDKDGDSEMRSSNYFVQKEEKLVEVVEEKKRKKKIFQEQIKRSGDEQDELHLSSDKDGEKKKKKSSKSKKRENDTPAETGSVDIYQSNEKEDRLGQENNISTELDGHEKRKSKKKRKSEKKVKRNVAVDFYVEANDDSEQQREKDHSFSVTEETKVEKRGEAGEEEILELSSGDEDCSRGMKKWVTDYYQSRPGLKVLQERIDEFITDYEEKKEQEKEKRKAAAADGGWTVVEHHRGRKKTTDSETGIAVGSVSQAAVMDNMARKKTNEVGLDFYRFQKREAKRNEIMVLQSKFEQDKKRIQQLRAARKFRPY